MSSSSSLLKTSVPSRTKRIRPTVPTPRWWTPAVSAVQSASMRMEAAPSGIPMPNQIRCDAKRSSPEISVPSSARKVTRIPGTLETGLCSDVRGNAWMPSATLAPRA
ncbi:hypothetical protein D3C73_1375570 [compost metagenome]